MHAVARAGACVLPADAKGGCGAPLAGGSIWAGEEIVPLPHGPMAGHVVAAGLWLSGQAAVARMQITGQGAHGAPIWLQCVSISGIHHVNNAMSVDRVRCVLQGRYHAAALRTSCRQRLAFQVAVELYSSLAGSQDMYVMMMLC